jgi:hypothetical protein
LSLPAKPRASFGAPKDLVLAARKSWKNESFIKSLSEPEVHSLLSSASSELDFISRQVSEVEATAARSRNPGALRDWVYARLLVRLNLVSRVARRIREAGYSSPGVSQRFLQLSNSSRQQLSEAALRAYCFSVDVGEARSTLWGLKLARSHPLQGFAASILRDYSYVSSTVKRRLRKPR